MMKIYQQHLVLKPTTSLHPLFIRTFLTVLLIILKQIIRFNYVFSIYCSLMHRPFKEVDTCVIEYIPMFWNFYFRLTTPYGSFQKLPPGRGIGYSFQLAITAPLYSIIGYCIATAQS